MIRLSFTVSAFLVLIAIVSAPARASCDSAYEACVGACRGGQCAGLCAASKAQCPRTGKVCLPSGWCALASGGVVLAGGKSRGSKASLLTCGDYAISLGQTALARGGKDFKRMAASRGLCRPEQ